MNQTVRVCITRCTKIIILLLMAANLAAFVLMPFYLRQTLVFFYGDAADSLLVFYYVLLYVTGALCFLILNNLRSLFNLMLKDQPFVRETERRLMRMGIEAFSSAVCLSLKFFVTIR